MIKIKNERQVDTMKKNVIHIFAVAFALVCMSLICSPQEADAKKMNNANQAQQAALKKVPGAQVTEVDIDMENGVIVYDVELFKGNKEYTLQYSSANGKLIEYGWDIQGYYNTDTSKPDLSKQQVQKKAKNKVKKAKILSVVSDYDDGVTEYKVRLSKGTKEYKLVYDAKSGKLIEYEWKIVPKKSAKASKYIGVKKAKSIALKKAPNATVIKCEFDNDDGLAAYEIEMREGMYEYDVKLNAKTGAVLEFEKDIDD